MRLSFPNLSLHDMTAPWVHASVPSGSEEFKEHAGFIRHTAMAGMIGLSFIPAALALKDHFTSVDAMVFALLASPLALATLVSRSGKLAMGKTAALACFALMIGVLVGATGGAYSPLAILLCILPVEATLWRCKNPVRLTLGLVAAAIAGAVATTSIVTASASVAYGSVWTSSWLAIVALAYTGTVALRMQKRLAQNAGSLARQSRHADLFSKHSGELFTRHAADGSTLFASPAARDILGVASKDLLDSGLLNRVHIQDRVVLLKSLSDAVQLDKEQSTRIRVRSAGSDDRLWKLIDVRCRADRDERSDSGDSVEAVCVMRDVTSFSEMEDSLAEARAASDELNGAQRRFLATMSHELRTPLNAIVGFSDILQQELFGRLPHQKHREYVNLIQDSGQHLLNVVNDMLDMSRIEAGKYELSFTSFEMAQVVDSTVAMLQPMAIKGGVNVTSQVDASLPELHADRRACQQILINLLSNAIKFTPEGGHVQLSVKQFGRAMRIRMKDDGIGINEEFMANIGQPFTQADTGHQRKFEGSGIGLSVVKGLVALHNGEFNIKSREGDGTTVTVTLPLAAPASKPVPTDSTSQLVHLKAKSKQASVPPVTAPVSSKGERRARVSA